MTTSTQWPDWVCKNNPEEHIFRHDTHHVKCPVCGASLVRWKKYEEKR